MNMRFIPIVTIQRHEIMPHELWYKGKAYKSLWLAMTIAKINAVFADLTQDGTCIKHDVLKKGK